MPTRYCIHQWSGPALTGNFDVRWRCQRCGETRSLAGDTQPFPGTFEAAAENFSNALRNVGLEFLATFDRPLRWLHRLLTRNQTAD